MKKFGLFVCLLIALILAAWQVEPIRWQLEPGLTFLEKRFLGWGECACKNTRDSKTRVPWIRRNDGRGYSVQRLAAERHGVSFLEDRASIDAAVSNGDLVRLQVRGAGYRISTGNFTLSQPYFTARTVEVFQDLTASFREEILAAGLPESRIVVSSGTRSEADQEAIRKMYSGATSGKSAHSYGAALDLVNVEVLGPSDKGSCDRVRALFAEFLKQRDDVFWVIEGVCLHITVKPE